MSAEQKAKIRATAKNKNASQDDTPAAARTEPAVEQVGGVAVEVAASQPAAAPKSLLDMVRAGIKKDSSKISSTPASKDKATGNEEESFIFAIVPVASGFLAYYASSLWADDYKVCAPSKAEVSAVLKPLCRVLARRLDVQLKETPDIRDMRMSATALLLYILRAATTSMEINERLEKERAVAYAEQHVSKNGYKGQQTAASPGYPGRGNHQTAGYGTGGDGGDASRGDQYERFRTQQPTTTQNGIETDAEYARRVISEAFKQDKFYREQHGLL